mmetsp:Transcript_138246/g.429769  ORF Transcript_138246/g.429769 Transcript_138246/m.429769 type:complete len:223 (-) Transcript_138246:873-1541(-)
MLDLGRAHRHDGHRGRRELGQRHHLEPILLQHEPQGGEHDDRHRLLLLARLHTRQQAPPPVQGWRADGGRHRERPQCHAVPGPLRRLLPGGHAEPRRTLVHVQCDRGRIRAGRALGRHCLQDQGLRDEQRERAVLPRREPGESGWPQREPVRTKRPGPGEVHQLGAEGVRPDTHGGGLLRVPRHGDLLRRSDRGWRLQEGDELHSSRSADGHHIVKVEHRSR